MRDITEDQSKASQPEGGTRDIGSAAVVVAGVAGLTVMASVMCGCDMESCQDVQNSYQQALESESGLAELSDGGPPHLGVAMQLDLVNELTSGLVDTAVSQALSRDGSLSVSGQSIDYSLASRGADLRFEASGACSACVQVTGDIDGNVDVGLPVVGTQTVPLSGSMDWTVPLDVGMDGDEAAIFFDTEEAVRMGTPTVDASLDGLSSDWAIPVTSALVSELSDAIASEVDPFRLVGYELPEIGPGVEIAPSLLALDEATNSLVLGIRTNLNVQASRQSSSEFVDALALGDGDNAALAVQPRLASEGVRLALRQDYVPRDYTLSGRASEGGPISAVVDSVDAAAHDRDGDALALRLDFRLFNYRSSLACYSMMGETTSRFAISDGEVQLDVEDVEFSGPTGLVEAANWGSAQFVEHSQGLIEGSLDDGAISIPETSFQMSPERVGIDAGMVVVRGMGSS